MAARQWTSFDRRKLSKAAPGEGVGGDTTPADYKLDNIIFSYGRPPKLLAVVDREIATLGDPLADLGWLLAFWRPAGDPAPELRIIPRVTEAPGFSTREELAALYAQRTGRALPARLRFYGVLALWKMAVLLEGHWARLRRELDGDGSLVTGDNGRERD